MINSDGTTDSEKGKPAATESVVEEIKADLELVDQSSSPVDEPDQGSEANEPNRVSSFTRRALLLKAGWAVPVILAVGLPTMVLAGKTSPKRHPDHKPSGHKKWPDPGKKHSHHDYKWPDPAKKKDWPDPAKKEHSHHYDRLWW